MVKIFVYHVDTPNSKIHKGTSSTLKGRTARKMNSFFHSVDAVVSGARYQLQAPEGISTEQQVGAHRGHRLDENQSAEFGPEPPLFGLLSWM